MSYITLAEIQNNELNERAKKAYHDISSILVKADNPVAIRNRVIMAAYILSKVARYNYPMGVTYQNVLDSELQMDSDVRNAFQDYISAVEWGALVNLCMTYSPEVFALAALLNDVYRSPSDGTTSTPDSVTNLALAILNINPTDSVADVCCGEGSFLVSAALDMPEASYYGCEINPHAKIIAEIRAELTGNKFEISLLDAFQLISANTDNLRPAIMQFSKVFSNYPFGMRLRNIPGGEKILNQLSEDYPSMSKATSSDWVFNALICQLLSDGGKAIGIMTNGSTWNSIDTPIRRYFLENGYVEAVIALPGKLFNFTNISTTMIVFSHGNRAVRMVDATNTCQMKRRMTAFSDSDIAEITEMLHTDSPNSKLVSMDELRHNEYVLNIKRYQDEYVAENAVPFEHIIRSISRGAPCTASQLDEMSTERATNMQFLMLSNIHDGVIDSKLPYLSYIDEKYEKYCLQDCDLILSKNGYPYKIAVASIDENKKILANGNLYIIRLDHDKVNPYYLKAFLDSNRGQAILKSITVGATLPNIGVDKLKKVMIPLPSLTEQARVAEKYQAILDEIAVLQLRIEKAKNRLHHILDEESEG